VIDMLLSKKQLSTMDMIEKLGDNFGDDRWFTQQELVGVTLHPLKALVSKGFLKRTEFDGIRYYRIIKRLGD